MGGWVGTDRRALLGSPQAGLAGVRPAGRRGCCSVLFCQVLLSFCMWSVRLFVPEVRQSSKVFVLCRGSPPAAARMSLSLHAVRSNCNTPSLVEISHSM